jgi:hypothetical protein
MSETNGKSALAQLTVEAGGVLALVDVHGTRHAPVAPVRCFPLTDPDHWIAICDISGHELAVVEDLGQLPAPAREAVAQHLARREFVPVIVRLLEVPADAEPTEWHVETDRGATRFTLTSADEVRRLSAHKALVIDSRGIRYLIPDIRELDATSRRVIERYFG